MTLDALARGVPSRPLVVAPPLPPHSTGYLDLNPSISPVTSACVWTAFDDDFDISFAFELDCSRSSLLRSSLFHLSELIVVFILALLLLFLPAYGPSIRRRFTTRYLNN
ncbi:hypothetical protein MSAN_00287500 [Mycena sanguinolenta]|uniref:Uncharacterized protein n=1 Tax=Mycena sanguinolenta TaxID=230812 RepID=A0A8H7DK00_9AGAR|nr:hypothetical protein MSAN_00287500 [Mycena sanguinolenta]